jgi:hypothetical protein
MRPPHCRFAAGDRTDRHIGRPQKSTCVGVPCGAPRAKPLAMARTIGAPLAQPLRCHGRQRRQATTVAGVAAAGPLDARRIGSWPCHCVRAGTTSSVVDSARSRPTRRSAPRRAGWWRVLAAYRVAGMPAVIKAERNAQTRGQEWMTIRPGRIATTLGERGARLRLLIRRAPKGHPAVQGTAEAASAHRQTPLSGPEPHG